MKKGQNTRGYERYLACDIHRDYILVGGQNEDQEWVLTPRRVSIAKFPEWAQKNLRKGDIVVLETTTNVWETFMNIFRTRGFSTVSLGRKKVVKVMNRREDEKKG